MSSKNPQRRTPPIEPIVPAGPVGSRPFGVGDFPGGALRFFNWGAFSQPLLWGVVYGVWPVVGATLLAGSIPYFVLLSMGAEQALSASTQFGVMAISGVLAAIVRIWSGMVANERAWNREAAVVLGVLAGKPRRTIAWYVERQVLWTRIGMIALIVATGAAAYMDYGVLEPAGATLAYYVVVQHFVWLAASVIGAAWIVKQEDLSPVSTGDGQVAAMRAQDSSAHSSEGVEGASRGLPLPGSDEIEAVIEQFHNVLGISEPGVDAGLGARSLQLASGVKMPVPGFGTYKIQAGDEAVSAVASALRSGYRNIDTASFYRNERSVGLAIRESGLDRSDIFISSKMWNDEQGYAGTLKAFDRTVAELGVQHLDLYLIHWPVQSTLESTWRALEHLYAAGRVSAIGVCNFDVHHLEQLMETASVVPMVNQIELHPRFQRTELTRYCKERGIAVQAWAPLMRGGVTAIEELVEIGRPHGKSAGQVALRWSIQEGYCPLPKSTDPVRIAENGAVLDFWLSPAEMQVVRGLDRDERIGPDPDLFSWNWPESTR